METTYHGLCDFRFQEHELILVFNRMFCCNSGILGVENWFVQDKCLFL